MKKLWNKGMVLILALTMLAALSACGNQNTKQVQNDSPAETNADKTEIAGSKNTDSAAGNSQTEGSTEKNDSSSANHDKVQVKMQGGETFVIELYPEYAPETVENFKNLVSEGFYDGLTFHRIVDGFMAQGGDPEGTGMGGSKKTIKGEFASNGFAQNTLSHTRGVISMARSNAPDSASSQFFICYDDASFLDGSYAAFGKVIEGMDTVDGFLKAERTANSMGEIATPVTPIVMEKVTLLTN